VIRLEYILYVPSIVYQSMRQHEMVHSLSATVKERNDGMSVD
jgi:hypothetical protein